MRRTPTFKQASIPQDGVIAGGKFDGWKYALVRLAVEKNGTVVLWVGVTKPNWPFPEAVHERLTSKDFRVLRAPGETAKRHDAENLIRLAMEKKT